MGTFTRSAHGLALALALVSGTVSPCVGAQTILTIGSGHFSFPGGVAVDTAGNVFVADFGNSAIKEVPAIGGSIPPSDPTVNNLGNGFAGPFGVAVDAGGNVFVADTQNNAVKEILAFGGYSTVNTLGSGFSLPTGVAVDASGNVFVADTANNVVKEIVAVNGSIPANPTIVPIGSGFATPHGVAVDGNGNVFVADYGHSAVKEMLAAGGYATVVTLGGGFSFASGVAVDAVGNVFVADGGNDVVKEILAVDGSIPPNPTVSVIGSGFNAPFGVAVDANGNVFVADFDNSEVKEIVARYDLDILIDDSAGDFIDGGSAIVYTIVAANLSSQAIHGATVMEATPANLVGVTWKCEALGGARCSVSGSGNVADTVDLPISGLLIYTVSGTVVAVPEAPLVNTVSMHMPVGLADQNPANNVATDTVTVGIFRNGFE